jgi:hypothetical protein
MEDNRGLGWRLRIACFGEAGGTGPVGGEGPDRLATWDLGEASGGAGEKCGSWAVGMCGVKDALEEIAAVSPQVWRLAGWERT